jgi:hypothetical protein
MLDAAPLAPLRVQAAPGIAVDRLVLGRPVAEVRAVLPRIFSLCRAAQGSAVEAALGGTADTQGIAAEVLRDHLLKLFVTWPGFFGCSPHPLPADWRAGGPGVARAVFGPAGRAPDTPAAMNAFLASGQGAAGILAKIDGVFAPGEAAADGLPFVDRDSFWAKAPAENSVAARHAHRPAMRWIEARAGRGPLWRAAARLWDLEAALHGTLPAPETRPGEASVPAARGTYGIRLAVEKGRVAAFARVTPTDHLLAAGGILDRALATLPATKAGLGPLMLDILDPCSPVRLREAAHA